MGRGFWRAPVAVAVGVLAAGCATKGFVREEIQKSEGRLDQQVGKLQGDLGQEQTRVTGVIAQAGEARKVADEATRLATDAASRANDAGARAAESSALAGKALAKAEDTDGRLTRLWGARNKWIPADTFTVTFGFDKWRLDDRAETAVLDAVKQLQANPGLIAALEGYSDTTGSPAHNLQLSQRRVEAVRRFLVEKGVDLHRVQSIGLGGVRPVADNKTKQGRAQNRRVTIKLFAPAE